MRNGQMLVERNPEDLIKQYGGHTLEDVFLKLCQNNRNEVEDLETNNDESISDRNLSMKCLATNRAIREETEASEPYASTTQSIKSSEGTVDQRNDIQETSTALSPLSPFQTEFGNENFSSTTSQMRLFSLSRKNFLRFKRNIGVTLLLIGLSIAQVALVFPIYKDDPFYLQVAIVNEERGGLNKFGERFLLSLSDHIFYKKTFDNFTSAYESLRKGESWAVLRVSSEFSNCIAKRVLEGIDASNETLQCSSMKLILDTSNQVIAATISKSVLASLQAFTTDLLISLGKNPLTGTFPVHFEEHYNGARATTLIDFLLSGILLLISYIMFLALSAMSLLAERKYGLLERATVAGATTTEFLLSDLFTLLVIMFLQVTTMLVVTFCVFNVPCNGPTFWVIAAVMLAGTCGISFGFLISTLTDDENVSVLIGCGSLIPTLFLSAAFLSLETMPHYLRYFSNCLPLTRIIESTRFVMIRGWNITDNYIWDGYLICSFWIAAHIAFSIILLKFRK